MKKALFLDRDGVINIEINYLHKSEDFIFIPEIFTICSFYQKQNYLIIVITNQAGIARGFYTEDDFLVLNNWMFDQFAKKGITIAKTYFCPHHPDFTGQCECRKPKPGMLLQAKNEYVIDMSKSILIGDKLSDIEAGKNAGIIHCYNIDDIIQKIDHLPLP